MSSFTAHQHRWQLHNIPSAFIKMFCFDKKEIEEIEVKWGNIGLPNVCFVISKSDEHYVLIYLSPDDYYPFFFKEVPIEDVGFANEKENEFLSNRLKPKVLQVLTNYVKLELKGKEYNVPRYDCLKKLKTK